MTCWNKVTPRSSRPGFGSHCVASIITGLSSLPLHPDQLQFVEDVAVGATERVGNFIGRVAVHGQERDPPEQVVTKLVEKALEPLGRGRCEGGVGDVGRESIQSFVVPV